MKKHPIILGISQHHSGRGAANNDALSPEIRHKVMERDDYTCRCCGFRSQKYQDVMSLGRAEDGGSQFDRLATLCIFCHQAFHMDQAVQMRSGVLIWLPEISQEDLHHLARAIYVARISQGPVADAARRALDMLTKRREDVRARLGTDEPGILVSVMRDYISAKAYEARDRKLDGVRLFPLDRRIIREADLEFNQFPQILAYWRSKDGPFSGRLPKDWIGLYKDLGIAAA